MSQPKKKVSLFKQKIAQARSKMETKESGFPVAPCILLPEITTKEDIPLSKESKTQTIKTHSFLSNFKGDKYVKPEELNKIETENWQKIDSMSENERQGMITSLKFQLPQSFIKRLNIKKEEPKTQSQNLQKLIEDKLESATSNPQMNEGEQSSEETWRELLKLNIETKSLEYTTKIDEKYVNLQKLAFLVGNQINHSQLVGGKLISMWSKAISQKLTTKTRQLVTINGVTIHGSYLGDKIGSIIEVCLKQIKNTTYSGIFIQLCASVSQAIVNIASLLNSESKKRIALQLESILQKIRIKKTVNITVQQSNNIKESLDAIKESLKTSEQEEALNWKVLIASIDSIIELIVLQEPGFKGYWQTAFKTAQKCSDLDELIELLEFIYQLVNKLIIKRNKQLYIDLKIHRERWAPAIDHIILKLVKSCWKLESQHMFKAVFLSRFVGGASWQTIAETTKLPGQKGQLICGFLLFNTLTDLKSNKITQEQIYLLNLTIEWLSGVFSNKNKDFLDPNYIFQTFLQVFLLEEQYYSLLNQQALQNLVKVILTHHKLTIKDHVSIQKVRTLSQNYCFSSYGNQSFTSLMLLIAVNGSEQVEEMILREVMTPYWKFFYEIGQKVQIKHTEQEKRNSNMSLKEELLKKIKEQIVQIGKNQFIDYLS